MTFELDAVFIEEGSRGSALAERIAGALPPGIPIAFVPDGRVAAMPDGSADPFGAGKRRMVVMRRRTPFLSGCPAASPRFVCCGYLVLALASNCPMDCSYCFLQEYVADNPGFQVFSNYADAFGELDRLSHASPGRHFRVGTGDLADSLAFDSLTGLSSDLIPFFAARENLTLELKTKTCEIGNLLRADPRGRVMVSWTLSPDAVFRSSEHRAASPSERIAAARAVLDAGYRIGFHFDPIISYPGAERDYAELADALLDSIPAARISIVSLGGLRMTPALKAAARRRFPDDPMLCGEDVLAPDGRYRTFTPLRLKLYRTLAERFERAGAKCFPYLCMEPASIHERVFGVALRRPAATAERLAQA